jgi:antitoxin component YwqK of YwqJK toxin-antitoxin module
VLENGSGTIRELQANGYVLKEGKVENHLKQGIWIYYSKFGLPEAIGAYKDGKKTGRWLKGDLGGLNLDDRICYMSEEEFSAWVNMFGDSLSLSEEFYAEGKLVSSNSVNTRKRR